VSATWPAGLLPAAAALAITAAFAALVAQPAGPAPARLALAFAALVLVPGYGAARWLLGQREAEWPERLAAAYGLGLAAQSALALAARLGHADYAFLAWALPALGVLLLVIPRPVQPLPTAAAGPRGGRAPAWALTVLAVAATAAWCGALGTPLGILTDSPVHIAALRRMAMGSEVLPLDIQIADTAGVGSDPRLNLYHVMLALLVRVGDVDPAVAWRWAGMLMAPLLPLAAYAFARRAAGSRAAGALAALLTPLVYGGGLASSALRQGAYPMRVADALALLALWAALGALAAPGARGVWLVAALAFAAVTAHLFAAVHLLLGLAALGLAAGLAYRRLPLAVLFPTRRAWFARLAVVAGAVTLACGPYLALRWAEAGAGIDPLHSEPQGLLYWWRTSLFTVDPRAAAAWLGWPALGLLAALPLLWRQRHEGLGPVALVAATVAGLGIALNPLALPLVHGALGYLAGRLLWCVPLAAGLAVALVLGVRSLTGAAGPSTRRLATVAVAGIALSLAPAAWQGAVTIGHARSLAESERSGTAEPWLDLLAALREGWGGPRVLLSDPFTAYAIPAYTGHHATAVLAQHANPRDRRGPERRAAVRDVLSPYVGARRTLEILRREGADAVVLNRRFDRPISYGNGVILPEQDAAVRAKFASHPESFRAAWASGGAYVYELTEAAKHGPLPPAGEPARPFVAPRAPQWGRAVPDGDFTQLGTRVVPARVAPGDSVFLTTYWRVTGERPSPPGLYLVSTCLDAPPPRGWAGHRAVSKLVRLAAEARTGAHRRILSFHTPADGLASPDEWRPGEVVEDRFPVIVHPRAIAGTYEVRVKMVRVPVYTNFHLRDLFTDDDRLAGPVVARLEVTPRAAAPAGRRPRRAAAVRPAAGEPAR
jgi:hypothetical protein